MQPRSAVHALTGDQSGRPQKMGWQKCIAWLPIPLFMVAILIVWQMDIHTSYESPNLLMCLNIGFSLLLSWVIVFHAGRSFIANGRPSLLLLSCGVIIWGFAGFAGVISGLGKSGSGQFNSNIHVTIHNTSVWIATLCHLSAAVLPLEWEFPVHSRRIFLVAVCLTAGSVVGFVVFAALSGWLPTFFVTGQGGTPVRQFVLASAIIILVLTAILLWTMNRPRLFTFAYWYMLALLMLAVGLFGFKLTEVNGSPLGWMGRVAQYCASIYMLVGTITSLNELSPEGITLERALSGVKNRHGVSITIAIALVFSSAVGRLVFLENMGTRHPYVTFFPAVMLAAVYGGFWAGIVATILSAVLISYFLLPPIGHFHFPFNDVANVMGMAIFVANGLLISWITNALHNAQRRAVIAETEAQFATERKLATEVLCEKDTLLRAISDNSPDPIFLKDCDGRMLYANPATLGALGKSAEEVLGKTDVEIYSDPETAQAFRRVDLDVIEGGQTMVVEEAVLTPAGPRVYLSTKSPYRDAAGRIIGIVGVARDISERKELHDKLTRILQEQSIILETAPVGISLVRGRKQVWLNNKTEEMAQYSREEMEGQTTCHFYPSQEAYERVGKEIYPILAQGLVYETEQTFIRKDGLPIHVRCVGKAIDPDKVDQGIIWILEDITERRRSQIELGKVTAEAIDLYNNAPCGYHSLDADGYFVLINDTELAWLGYERKEVINKIRFRDVLTPASAATFDFTFDRLKVLGSISEIEYEVIRKDGTILPLFLSSTVIKDNNGNFLMSRTTSFDISSRKAAEKDLIQSRIQLQQLSAHLESVREEERLKISREVHDELGQSLTALKFDISALKGSETCSVSLAEKLEGMEKIVRETIASVQRITAELRPRLLDDLGLVPAIEWQMGDFERRTGIQCQVDLCENPLVAPGSSITIIRILQEALSNIIRHADAKEVSVKLSMDDGLVFTIADDGRGIIPEQLDKADSFGLMGMRERAISCGGSLYVSTTQGQGTMIRLHIPLDT